MNELEHTGVLGMKWGVHRNSSKSTESSSHKNTKEPKKNVKDINDDDLRKIINRMQMEQQYSQLSKKNVGRGREYLQKVVKAGTTVAAVSTTALTLYNNANKIKSIVQKTT